MIIPYPALVYCTDEGFVMDLVDFNIMVTGDNFTEVSERVDELCLGLIMFRAKGDAYLPNPSTQVSPRADLEYTSVFQTQVCIPDQMT